MALAIKLVPQLNHATIIEKRDHGDNSLPRFFRIGPTRNPIHQFSNRRGASQDVPGHHDETHLHGKGEEFPEPFSPCLNRLVGSGTETNFRLESPDKG